ncbi:TonB-dependent receptor [Phenylobacterium sp.]|uniref:TonB-dependent receptor n=1 Tax=Phenylobacterium sp. TaxID=1871053 RepID=UPI0035B2258E
MKIRLRALCGASTLVIAAMGASTAALAQQQQQQADGVLQEIVVTAQRRAENLQDTAISVSAITSQTLKDAGIGRMEDFSNALPNVYVSPRDLRTTAISIRGISADTNNPGLDQSVGVYIDGVYMGRAATINSNLFDLERIETLRGPQGTLYGRNTIAGAVNILTRKPTAEPRQAASLSLGSDNAVRANAVGSGPIAQSLYASLALSVDKRDGLVKNTATGTKLDDIDSLGGRFALVYDPGGAWDFTFRADASRDRTHSGAYDVLDNGAFAGTPYADASPTDRTVAQSIDTTQNRDIYGASGELNWRMAAGTLTSISAFRGYDWNNVQDNDYTVLDLLGTGIREHQTQTSQELRFASDASGRFSYVVGAFYYFQKLKTTSLVLVGTDLGIYPTTETATIRANVDTSSYAAFGRAVYKLSDELSLAAGLRYTYETKSLDFQQIGDPYGVIAGDVGPRSLDLNEDKVTPSVTLEWRPAPKLLAYGTFSQGYKSGGFNVFSITDTDDGKYRPETVNNYEVGLKSEFFDSRLRVNASVFYMDYQDLQQNQLIATGAGVARYQTSNAAKAHSQGVELEVSAAPTSSLQLTANYGYLDAKFDSYPNATAAGADFTDHRLPLAAKTNFSAAAEWTHPITGGLDLFVRGEATYRSRIYFAADNAYSDPALTLLNARIGVGSSDKTWRLSAWGRNLADKDYAINRFVGAVVPGQVLQALGAPRSFGVELTLDY